MKLLCAILAGGEGRRMGGAKPLRPWAGTTLIANAAALARRHSDAVVAALRTPDQAGALGMPVVLDPPGVAGPLAGLAAALEHARDAGFEAVLTLPCDMPRLPGDLADRLRAAIAASPQALAAVARTGEDLIPVCALWRTPALDHLPAYLASGRRSLHGFAEACAAVTVDWPQAMHPRFAGANTPDELAALAGERIA